jgi:hypothetical protein
MAFRASFLFLPLATRLSKRSAQATLAFLAEKATHKQLAANQGPAHFGDAHLTPDAGTRGIAREVTTLIR